MQPLDTLTRPPNSCWLCWGSFDGEGQRVRCAKCQEEYDRDLRRMQALKVTIERVRTRYDVAFAKGPDGPGCGAGFSLWAEILLALQSADRFYQATLSASERDAQDVSRDSKKP